jgi:hypothetical protein
MFSKPRGKPDRRVDWYELAGRSETISSCLERTLSAVRNEAAVESFDLIAVNAAEIGRHAGVARTLISFTGATAIILEDLASVASYAVYSALRNDPSYVLLCHGPGTQDGYAIFRRVTSREEPGGPAREASRIAAHDADPQAG